MREEITAFSLRMPMPVRKMIEVQAKENFRSLNSEIISLIHDGLASRQADSNDDLEGKSGDS